MTRRSGRLMALLFLTSLWLGVLVSPGDAQVTTIETVPPEVDDEGRTASERVDGVVVMLRILGVVVVVSMEPSAPFLNSTRAWARSSVSTSRCSSPP